LCNKSFSQSSNLQSHKRRVHSNRKPHHCPYCGKLFNTNGNLTCHVRIHTGAKPYSCRHCSERFTWHHRLKTHLLKSHNEGTWLTCRICQKKFSHSGSFKEHLRRHEGVKPYICSECPKRFSTTTELKRHQLSHSDYKQFCCGLCDKYFKRIPSVKRHFKRCSGKLGFSFCIWHKSCSEFVNFPVKLKSNFNVCKLIVWRFTRWLLFARGDSRTLQGFLSTLVTFSQTYFITVITTWQLLRHHI